MTYPFVRVVCISDIYPIGIYVVSMFVKAEAKAETKENRRQIKRSINNEVLTKFIGGTNYVTSNV